MDNKGMMAGDVLGLHGETVKDTVPLLETVMKNGKRVFPSTSLEVIRERFKKEFKVLPEGCKALEHPDGYPVQLSAGLLDLQTRMKTI